MRVIIGAVPARRALKLAELTMMIVGVLALGYCLVVFLEAKYSVS
jgi:hypothetical protein